MITPQRRQELALGAIIAGASLLALAAAIGLRRWRRRHS
jgi:hypothetical protein